MICLNQLVNETFRMELTIFCLPFSPMETKGVLFVPIGIEQSFLGMFRIR